MAIHTMSHAGRGKASRSVLSDAKKLFDHQIPKKGERVNFFKKRLMNGEKYDDLYQKHCVKCKDN